MDRIQIDRCMSLIVAMILKTVAIAYINQPSVKSSNFDGGLKRKFQKFCRDNASFDVKT